MTDTSTRRSLALRRPEASAALRPHVLGYTDFSGVTNEYISGDRAALASCTTLEFAVRCKLDALGQLHNLAGWDGATAAFYVFNNNALRISLTSTVPSTIGNAGSTLQVPQPHVTTMPVWLRAKLTVATAACEYWYSVQQVDTYEEVTWTALGPLQTGTNAGATPAVAFSTPVIVGNTTNSGGVSMAGQIYSFYEFVNGVKTSWFNDTDIPEAGATAFVSAGGGALWTPSAATALTAFIPTQSYHGALRSDYVFDEVMTGLGDADILGVVGVDHTKVRVSYHPTNIPNHPTIGNFEEAMVIRSTAGFPATNLDGAMIMRHLAGDPQLMGGWASVVDSDLIGRQWYYYALFVRYDATSGWFKVDEHGWLNPGQYGYPDRIWNAFPNYYRRIDQGIWLDPGYLRRICNTVGYEFDLLRTWASTIGDVWDFDKISAKLLPEAGAALGLIKEAANGDRRLRTLVGNLLALRKMKGTKDGVEGYVAALSGWPTRAYEGLNLIHRQQHAEWPYGWATPANGSEPAETTNYPGWSTVTGTPTPSTPTGTLTRQIAASNEGSTIGMADGSFYLRSTNNTGAAVNMKLQYGHGGPNAHQSIPVIPGHSYVFSTALKASASVAWSVAFMWLNELGVQISSGTGTLGTIGTTWVRAKTAAFTCPATAKYLMIQIFIGAAGTLPNTTGTVNIWRPLVCDTAWRPEGIPTLQKNPPLSSALAGDVGTFVHQDYYESPREVKVNVYPMRTNLALNSDFLLNNLPAGAWATFDSPTYAQVPVAYSTYDDIVDAEPGDSETTYADLAGGLAPLVGSLPVVTYDAAAGGRLIATKGSAPYAFTLMHTYFPATDLGGMSAAIGAYTNVTPTTDQPYLNPMVATVTTPDPGALPTEDGVLVFKVRGPILGAGDGAIAGQMPGSPNDGWEVRRGSTIAATFYPDRLAWVEAVQGGPPGTVYHSHVAGVAPTQQDEYLAMSWDFNPANLQRRLTVYQSPDGVSWAPLPSRLWQAAGLPVDTTSVMRIGASSAAGNRFNGRIYWVEQRTGLDPAAGDIVWRFDASDYPGTGTTWTDPRGRAWTMTAGGGIVKPNQGTKMSMAFEWYTDNDVIYRINESGPVGLVGTPKRTTSPTYTLATSERRYECVDAVPPVNALYGRLLINFSNDIPFDVSLTNALIEDAPYPEAYFNGTWPDGDDGDFFFAVGKGYTGAAHLSPSVYYQQFRHFASGLAGSDKLTQLMPLLLPFRRSFKVLTAATGLYNATT